VQRIAEHRLTDKIEITLLAFTDIEALRAIKMILLASSFIIVF